MKRWPGAFWRQTFSSLKVPNYRLYFTGQSISLAGLVDEMHLAIAPVLLGAGERLFGGLPGSISGYSCAGLTSSAGIAHAHLTRTQEPGK